RPAECYARLPGLTTRTPRAQSGHDAGSYAATSSLTSDCSGTSSSARGDPRSTIDAAPTTCAPAASATAIVSRVEPPVVITSSTISTRSSGSSVNPRRSMSAPSCRSAKSARTRSARPTSCPITIPPSAGDSTAVACRCRVRPAIALPRRSAYAGCCSTSALCRYRSLCSPDESLKCPSSSAPDSRNRSSTSPSVMSGTVYSGPGVDGGCGRWHRRRQQGSGHRKWSVLHGRKPHTGASTNEAWRRATFGLIELLDNERKDWSEHVLLAATDRFERRLTHEISLLHQEFHTALQEGLAAIRSELATTRVETLRWSFVFWIGQVATVAALPAFMLRVWR